MGTVCKREARGRFAAVRPIQGSTTEPGGLMLLTSTVGIMHRQGSVGVSEATLVSKSQNTGARQICSEVVEKFDSFKWSDTHKRIIAFN